MNFLINYSEENSSIWLWFRDSLFFTALQRKYENDLNQVSAKKVEKKETKIDCWLIIMVILPAQVKLRWCKKSRLVDEQKDNY